MKKTLTLATLFSLALAAQSAVIIFNISPPGTDAAVGLSPLNQVAAPTNSTGSGNELLGGISFDSDTALLTLAVGFGSSAGFTDLSAPASALHIHGPAAPGTNAGVVISLAPYLFSAPDPARGGIIFGQVPIPTNEVANLLAGLHYINIHTTNNPDGEIRGQLIPILNQAPVVACPAPTAVECGGAISLTAQVSDADGDALTVVWTVNGVGIQTNQFAAGTTTSPQDCVFIAEFPLGTNTVVVEATDSAGASSSCSTTVVVVDTIPPVVTSVRATPDLLWPANHKMVAVTLDATVTDLCGSTTWRIISITSSEAVNAQGDGNTSPDWEITGLHTAKLRAERSGVTGPRIYTLTVQAEDASGNLSQTKTVTVTVPHDRRR